MLRTGQLLAPIRDVVAPLRRRDLARRREPRYQGPWRLPGPDSHRLAAMSLSLGYAVFLLSLWRPNCWTHAGSPGASQPPAPTDPGVTVSRHPALVVLVTRTRPSTPSGRTAVAAGQ